MRAMVLNGTKMSCYDQIKGMITKSNVVPAGTVNSLAHDAVVQYVLPVIVRTV